MRNKTLNNDGLPAEIDLSAGLISVWEFDEISGTTAYDQAGSNDGTISGATVDQVGILDKCYDYNGTTDFVGVVSSDISFPLTLSSWFNSTETVDGYYSLVSKGSVFDTNTNFDMGIRPQGDGDGNPYIYWKKSGTFYGSEIGSGKYLDGNWHHVVAVIQSNGNVELFVDNISKGINTSNGNPSATSHDIQFGKWSGTQSTSKYFDGLIDQTAIWNRVLETNEITYLYNSGNGRTYNNW